MQPVIDDRRRNEALRTLNRRSAPRARFFREWLKSVVIALALFLVMRSTLVEAYKIASGSMEGTLFAGDFLIVNKLVYGAELPFTNARIPGFREPERGDVIIFQAPQDLTQSFVKRVVGTPGDTLAMRDGRLYRNGSYEPEPYAVRTHRRVRAAREEFQWQLAYLAGSSAARQYAPTRDDWGPIVVPSRSYFVLGDNRDNSQDSRYWGFVPDSLVRGQPVFVYYSYDSDSPGRDQAGSRVRWARVGSRVH
ncbi:signal peptidase I [soil metagenome]